MTTIVIFNKIYTMDLPSLYSKIHKKYAQKQDLLAILPQSTSYAQNKRAKWLALGVSDVLNNV